MQQPLFSIIIPCYNDGQYTSGLYIDRLLKSIADQCLKKCEIEVIISDDNSPVSYDSMIKPYRSTLTIKEVKSEGMHKCPGNTRQAGINIATGQWLCFADHDDYFCPGALSSIKKVINEVKEPYLIYSDFQKIDSDGKVIESFPSTSVSCTTFTHGKFYNYANLWEPFRLHFPKDLQSSEDIALSRQVEIALNRLHRTPTCVQLVTYAWTYSENSLSSSFHQLTYDAEYDVFRGYLETHFNDWLRARVDTIVDAYNDNMLDQQSALILAVAEMATIFLMTSRMKIKKGKTYLKVMDAYASRVWNRIKKEINASLAEVKVLLATSLSDMRKNTDDNRPEGCEQSYIGWLSELDTIDYNSVIDAEIAKHIRAAKNDETTDTDKVGDRPFFSIVIACYNDGRYSPGTYLDRLLSSIARQGMNKDEVEVILSDDQSPVPFDSIIAQHEDKLTIKYIKTDYNFAPGNTRAKGLEIATGEWLCFADHDDMFYDNALSKIKKAIEEKEEKHFIFGDFYGVDKEGNVIREFKQHLNWCHGKFYNKDNFWDKYNIHFIHDLKSHEDIAICTQVACALSQYVPTYSYLNAPIYAWTDNPESISHSKFSIATEDGEREFLEVFFADYLQATGWIYIEQFKQHTIKMAYAIKSVLEITCYAYFYMQGFQFRRPDDFYSENLDFAGQFISACKSTFNMTNETMFKAIAANGAYLYCETMKFASGASGRYIPTQTLRQWLDLVSPEQEENAQ